MIGSTAMLDLGSAIRHGDQNVPDSANSSLYIDLRADLQYLLIDMTGLAWLLNDTNAGNRQKLHHYTFHDTIISLGYRIINISPLGGLHSTSRIANVVHLGLAAFLMTFLRRLDHRVSSMPLLSKLARSAAQEQSNNEKMPHDMLLWILFIGDASLFERLDDIWLIPTVTRTMRALNLHMWEDVQRALVKWPWVSTLHDKTGEALWHRSTSSSTRLAGSTAVQNDSCMVTYSCLE